MCRISDLLVIKHWAENCSVFVGHVIEHTILRGTSKKMKRWHEWAFSCSSSHLKNKNKNSLCKFFSFFSCDTWRVPVGYPSGITGFFLRGRNAIFWGIPSEQGVL